MQHKQGEIMTYRIRNFSFISMLVVVFTLAGCDGQSTDQDIESNAAAENTATPQAQSQTRTADPKPEQSAVSGSEWTEPQAAAKPVCTNCGTIAAITQVTEKGEGSLVGVVAGGAAGGLLGNQIGDGSGKKLATVAGAIGGAIAGHEVERHVRAEKYYEVTVNMDNGGTETVKIANGETLAVGQRVQVEGENIYLQ